MSTIMMDKKEELVMRLVHYFVTECDYTPIVVNGVKNEIWLENIDGPYRIIRINSNYIHNSEQYKFDVFKTKNIVKQIKKKTLSFSMNTLNIFLDLNKEVKTGDEKDISAIVLNNQHDVTTNKLIIEAFPNINDKLLDNTKGVDLIINVTNDINKKTAEENKKYEATFKKKKIIITYVLIGICVLFYLLSLLFPNLLYMFANNQSAVKNGQWYRLFTCIFFHANIVHLVFNMYALYIIGSQVENYIGKVKYLFIFLFSGLFGSLLSIVFSTSFSVGASGAIFGLMGSLLYFGYHYRLYLGSIIKSQIIPLIVLNLILGFMMSGIDNMAHIGGLIGGYLATMALGIKDKSSKNEIINGWIVLFLLFIFLTYIIFTK